LLRGQASERKQRLFACPWIRRLWGLLPDGRSRRAAEVIETLRDGFKKVSGTVILGFQTPF